MITMILVFTLCVLASVRVVRKETNNTVDVLLGSLALGLILFIGSVAVIGLLVVVVQFVVLVGLP